MKANFLNLALILVFLGTFTACSGDNKDTDTPIEASELPQKAQDIVSSVFADAEYAYVKKEEDKGKIEYEVTLSNGFKFEFDQDGNWASIDGNTRQIPDELIPAPVLTYVQTHYPKLFIEEIEKKTTGYEVGLSDDTDLNFDTEGTFLGAHH